MSRESTNSPEVVAIRLEHVPLMERLASVIYLGLFALMMVVLWAMAETRSLEAKTIQFPPFPAEMVQAASGAGGDEADATPLKVQEPTDRSTSSSVVTPSATSW